MIGYLSSSVDSDVGLNVFKIVVEYFKYLAIIMMSSGFCNSHRMHCFIFLLNFLYFSFASLFLEVVP